METPLGPVHAYQGPGQGSLPPLVLLHGIGASATPFAPLVMRTLPHVRGVVVPDYPGHGFSAQPGAPVTIEALLASMTVALDTLLEEPAIVVGNSLGGVVALAYAQARPEKVRGLVLLSPAGAPSSEEEWRSLMAAFGFTSRAGALAFLRRVYHRLPPIAHLIAHEVPAATMQRRAVRDLLASATRDSAVPDGALAQLKMPVLLVWGKSERLLPPSHLAWYRSQLPSSATVEEPKGLGHVPQGDSPHRVAKRIVAFAGSC